MLGYRYMYIVKGDTRPRKIEYMAAIAVATTPRLYVSHNRVTHPSNIANRNTSARALHAPRPQVRSPASSLVLPILSAQIGHEISTLRHLTHLTLPSRLLAGGV